MAKTKEKELTPMRKQYLEIKRQYPDCLLFFRLGDFYEMFDEDAKTASAGAGSHPDHPGPGQAQGANRPPCAVCPTTAARAIMARLIAKGYKVAICEQMEDPGHGQGAGGAGTSSAWSPPAP